MSLLFTAKLGFLVNQYIRVFVFALSLSFFSFIDLFCFVLLSECEFEGLVRAHGDVWRADVCTTCSCYNGSNSCVEDICLSPPCAFEQRIRKPGECCFVCGEGERKMSDHEENQAWNLLFILEYTICSINCFHSHIEEIPDTKLWILKTDDSVQSLSLSEWENIKCVWSVRVFICLCVCMWYSECE